MPRCRSAILLASGLLQSTLGDSTSCSSFGEDAHRCSVPAGATGSDHILLQFASHRERMNLAKSAKRVHQAPSRLDPSQLRLVWSDEFDGSELDQSKWNTVHSGGGFGNGELQFYKESNARVANGTLTITAQCEDFENYRYTSAKLTTQHKGDWGPGHRLDIRAWMPRNRGNWAAIWMMPTLEGSWPQCGEIDIAEAVGCVEGRIHGTVHTGAYNHLIGTQKTNNILEEVEAWHTYSIEWTATEILWYVDDVLYFTYEPDAYTSDKWPYDKTFYLILNNAVGGSWGGFCLPYGYPSCAPDGEFARPQEMKVDFARVYAL